MSKSIWWKAFLAIITVTACTATAPLPTGEPVKATSTWQPFIPNSITPAPTISSQARERAIDGMPEILIPDGAFLMGASEGDTLALPDEFPQHVVTLGAYWIDQHEVTNAQYTLCVAAGACDEPYSFGSRLREQYYDDPQFEQYPVLFVDWYMARDYCAWVGGSLPTEAQWEKAARGTDGRIYPWGDVEPNAGLLNFRNYEGDTTEICTFKTGNSPYGLCDMAGNVWEWTADIYAPDHYTSSPASDPTGPSTGSTYVLRGGSWFDGAGGVRSSDRDWNYQDFAYSYVGFRCARVP